MPEIRTRRGPWRQPALALLAAMALGAAAQGQEPAPTPAPGAAGEAAAPAAPAAEPTLQSLQQQIDALQEQLRVLQRKAEIAAQADAEKAKAGAGVRANVKDGFTVQSNDGAFVLRIRGYVQVDGREYGNDPSDHLADTFLVRRARPILEGTIAKRFGFRFMPDFGQGATVLQDAYGEWTFAPWAVLRGGRYKPPVGLERLQSDTDLAFAERSLVTTLTPDRDIGLQLGGAIADGRVEYAAGVFDGSVDNASSDTDANDDKDVDARVMFSPWKGTTSPVSGLSFGVGGSQGQQHGTLVAPALPSYRTAGQQTFFSYRADATAAGTTVADGTRSRISPQASYYNGPLGVLAEYARSSQEVRRDSAVANLTQTAWEVTGFWVLTGENASFKWHAPRRGWDRDAAEPTARGFGAIAIMARYNELVADADAFPVFASATAVQEARGWAVGVDWTLQRFIRLMADYEVTSFSGLGLQRPDEKVFFTRFQIGW